MEIIHFKGADKILKDNHMYKDVISTLKYVEDVLFATLHKRELLRQALEEMGWRPEDNGALRFLDGRRYEYKGFKRDIAIEGNFSAYEFILEGLLRLQIGFDKGLIQAGILMLTNQRSEKSSYGSSVELAKSEIEMLYPTISLPVSIAFLDLGHPMVLEEGGDSDGVSVSSDE
ncbi:MAG: hypothetical protein JRF34_09410 [Deltaproteobacteria bacterium]|nr:hypothetical protein [Deltaproteobacteria bacterium]